MSSPFVAEIKMFAGNFAPTGWALCDGQLLPISQNTALFSLLGTFYGGDGKSTFALPNLQNSAPMHPGQGSGLTERFLGEQSGSDFITLLEGEMPSHNHIANARTSLGNSQTPAAQTWAGSSIVKQYVNTVPNTPMSPQALAPTGGSLPHNNLQPYLVVTFIIALQGVFPPRS
ncbi:MAG: tail fiber protein [Pyrinomonadaceae bacterium]